MSIASQLDIKAFFIGILSRIYNAIPEPETQYIIEDKNIHFIWIGSEIPLKYINNILRCSEINKFYDIFIWSDYHFPTILMNTPNIICRNLNTIILKNKELIDQISAHAGKVDVIRLEVIYNYGGIYSDMDIEPIKNFDIIMKSLPYKDFELSAKQYFLSKEISEYSNNNNSNEELIIEQQASLEQDNQTIKNELKNIRNLEAQLKQLESKISSYLIKNQQWIN